MGGVQGYVDDWLHNFASQCKYSCKEGQTKYTKTSSLPIEVLGGCFSRIVILKSGSQQLQLIVSVSNHNPCLCGNDHGRRSYNQFEEQQKGLG